MKKVYFLRHGQTKLNVKHIHQFAHTELSELGIRQATAIAKKLKGVRVDTIISSPLVRAKQTADIVAKELGMPVETNELFVELRRPSQLWGVSWYTLKSFWIMGNLYFRVRNPKWHHSDEENLFEFHTRAKNALNYLANRPEEHLLVVTHRGLMANLVGKIKTDGLDTIAQFRRALWKNFKMGNCYYMEAEWTPDGEWGESLIGTWHLNEGLICPELDTPTH